MKEKLMMACISRKGLGISFIVFLCTLRATLSAAAGYGALVVGVPYESLQAGQGEAGAVNVLYATLEGLSSAGNQLWSQGSGLPDAPEYGDHFGSALATGDFNNDGFPDLAIGVPVESIGSGEHTGVVHILYGTAGGRLKSGGNQVWQQDTDGIAGVAEDYDEFGTSLAAGDFNKDGYSDLAIGVPGEDIGATQDAGAVNIIYGSATGLSSTGNQIWYQGTDGIPDAAEEDDKFGYSLTAGDFNNDGHADLAIGVPYEDIGATQDAGAVNIIYGSANGLSSTGNQMWYQGKDSIAGAAEASDNFGRSLTAGDFNNDGHADLAIGVPDEAIGATAFAGAVNIIYGSATGLSSTGSQIWYQGTDGIAGAAEEDDSFGSSLTVGDFNNDGHADLAIGVPDEAIGATAHAGAVNIIYGSATGLSSTGNQMWYQGTDGIAGVAAGKDLFGSSLTAGDFNNDGHADLAIGVPREDIGATNDAGAVNIIYGSATGLSSTGNQMWYQGKDGIADTAEANDHFGRSLVYLPPPRSFPWAMFLPAISGKGVHVP
jgi:hypothetical protein